MRTALVILVLLLSAPALAADVVVYCGGFHFVRPDGTGGSEIGVTSYLVRNLDTANPLTWRRLTIRNLFGDVIHDSGPAAGTPLPLNFDIPGGLDVTVVPPGASFYLTTNFIWGNAAIPGPVGQGNSMTVRVEVAAETQKLVEVTQSIRERQLFTPVGSPPFQGPIRARDVRVCTPAK